MTDKLIEAVARAMKQRCSEPFFNIPTLDTVPAGSLGIAWQAIARAAIAAIEASGTHRVVPVEPTDQMVGVGVNACCTSHLVDDVVDAYAAMLAAAPKVVS